MSKKAELQSAIDTVLANGQTIWVKCIGYFEEST